MKRLFDFILLRLWPRSCSNCDAVAVRRSYDGKLLCGRCALRLAVSIAERSWWGNEVRTIPKDRA